MKETLLHLDMPAGKANVVLHGDRVVDCSPSVYLMRKWTEHRVREFCRGKKWKVSVIYVRPLGKEEKHPF